MRLSRPALRLALTGAVTSLALIAFALIGTERASAMPMLEVGMRETPSLQLAAARHGVLAFHQRGLRAPTFTVRMRESGSPLGVCLGRGVRIQLVNRLGRLAGATPATGACPRDDGRFYIRTGGERAQPGRLHARIVHAGARRLPTGSNTIALRIRPRLTKPRGPRATERIVGRVVLPHARSKGRVLLQRRAKHGWRTLAATRPTRLGRYSFARPPARATAQRLRVRFVPRKRAFWLPASTSFKQPPSLGIQALRVALSMRGTPYSYGGSTPGGFDCSGLMYYAYLQAGVTLPRVAADQGRVGQSVARSELQPGDLVIFRGGGHVGMYAGGGRYVHSPHSGDVVRVESLASRGDYDHAVRISS